MHMMFVDESGDTGYPPDGNWRGWGGSKLFVRVGAIIHGWRWKAWNERIISFKRNRGLTWDSEIKSTALRRGTGVFDGWEATRRRFFLGEMLDLISGNPNITLLGVAIDKRKVDITAKGRVSKPEIRSMEFLLERYNLFLREQRDKTGIVILDPTQQRSDDNVRQFQCYLQARSQHLHPLNIVEGTFFAKSHTSNMVQVADICSSVLYRHEIEIEGGMDEFRRLSPRFWRYRRKLQGYGIKRWPV